MQPPTSSEVRAVAETCGLSLSDADVESFRDLMADLAEIYDTVEAAADEVPQPKWPRDSGRAPAPGENPRNAWYRFTAIKGAPTGPLAGRRIAVKDNIMVAGVPMMNGAATLEGFVPDFDATVVTRVLDAGGEIVGKTHCECLCLSAGSHTNATGPVHNPHRMGFSAGGSSSGNAVVVALGEADMAIGGDQGGSVRMPASFSGICGMKPTFGLVPYTGIMPIEITLDHAGPMTATVADNALLLQVIAGDDGFDPRIKAPVVGDYGGALEQGVDGLRIALVTEGFRRTNAEDAVNAKVEAAAGRLAAEGAEIDRVSIPAHGLAGRLWVPIATEGLATTLMWGDGYGASRTDLYGLKLMEFHRGWRDNADRLSETAKLLLMFGTHAIDRFGTRHYAKAMNVARRVRRAYDDVLRRYDLLMLPTTPMKATALPPPDASRADYVARAFEVSSNTAPFNLTHHPAMSVPCGTVDGLPVGAMLVGRHFEETTIYRAAQALERSADWRSV